ncbi:TMEM43 family protein [Desulfomarina sp.]
MGNDTFSITTETSWFKRIGNAFKGILAGIVMVLLSLGLLFWNEGRAVERYKSLVEGGGKVLSIDKNRVLPENNGKLVHVSGKTETEEVLTDPDFGITASAIKLIRHVEMYQWQESRRTKKKKKLGGGEETVTTYSYRQEWSGRLIDSGGFQQRDGHENPKVMAYGPKTVMASHVRLGAFTLPQSLLTRLGNKVPFPVPADVEPQGGAAGSIRHGGGFYLGDDPAHPKTGDMRIRYFVVLPTEISIVARQVSSTFEPYHTVAGGDIELLETGIHTADSMFLKARQSNTVLTWALRFAGFFLMTVGLSMILSPLVVFADVVPMIGSIIGAGTTVVAAFFSALLTCVTIGIAWLFYRPLLGLTVLGGAFLIGVLLFRKIRRSEPVMPPPVPHEEPPSVP